MFCFPVHLFRYCEERPLLLSNIGMGARLCTYYLKSTPGDQMAASLQSTNSDLGNVLALDPADKSPFLGDIKPGCYQSSLETNMYRAPLFPHKLSTTDYLLVRSAKGTLSLRRIDKLYVVGQQVKFRLCIQKGPMVVLAICFHFCFLPHKCFSDKSSLEPQKICSSGAQSIMRKRE